MPAAPDVLYDEMLISLDALLCDLFVVDCLYQCHAAHLKLPTAFALERSVRQISGYLMQHTVEVERHSRWLLKELFLTSEKKEPS